ncbi:MAG: hypothetical protein INQ03_11600 [Candidatus Heimdallarchaeota archaeon]|nr:hypothetical protein [Candidatus Heimdallarchaeota archaeon]
MSVRMQTNTRTYLFNLTISKCCENLKESRNQENRLKITKEVLDFKQQFLANKTYIKSIY